MEPVADQPVKEYVEKEVTFPCVPTDDGKGLLFRVSEFLVEKEPTRLSRGMPKMLAGIIRRQPSRNLRNAKPLDNAILLVEFKDPVDSIEERLLRQHILHPMALKVRRSHKAAKTAHAKRNRRGQPSGAKGYHNQQFAQVSI